MVRPRIERDMTVTRSSRSDATAGHVTEIF